MLARRTATALLSLMGALALAMVVLMVGLVAHAEPRRFKPAQKVRMVNCPSSGTGVSTTLPEGPFKFFAFSEKTCLCLGTATCSEATGLCLAPGAKEEIVSTDSQTVSCWSASSTGITELVPWVR